MKNVMFVTAHADDIELIAGGTLAKCIRMPDIKVFCLVFSLHYPVTEDTRMVLENYRKSMNDVFGLKMDSEFSNHLLEAVNGDFQKKRDFVYRKILETVKRRSIDTIITHSTTDTNQDHQQVTQEVIRSCKKLCTILGGEFPSNDMGDFNPRYYEKLELKDVMKKADACECYTSQQFNNRNYLSKNVIQSQAMYRGHQVNAVFAEAFEVIRMIAK